MNAQQDDIAYILGGFNRYMNRPLAKVHCLTWKMANAMQENCPSIRLLRPYRDEANKKFRWRLAQQLKSWRYIGKIELPFYDEALGQYVYPAQA